MKTVEYEGKMYEVEDWARFIARDYNEKVFVYERKPQPSSSGKLWHPNGPGFSKQVFPINLEDDTTKAGNLKEI